MTFNEVEVNRVYSRAVTLLSVVVTVTQIVRNLITCTILYGHIFDSQSFTIVHSLLDNSYLKLLIYYLYSDFNTDVVR